MIYLKIYLLIGVVLVAICTYRDLQKGIHFTLSDLLESLFWVVFWPAIPLILFYDSHWANKVLIRGRRGK